MSTFDVSDVQPSRQARAAVSLRDSLQTRTKGPIEACGSNLANHVVGVAPVPSSFASGTLTGMLNPFVEAASVAFMEHHPLILSPDDVWLCVAQGFGLHVNVHAEALRGRLVRHDGKETIEVRRDDFVKGASTNEWPACLGQISDEIAKRVGGKRDLVVANFSTTGAVEKAAYEVVLMSAMQSYCDYVVSSLCGIPRITLLGTIEDWRSIRRRAEVLAEFDLAWWVSALLPVLDQFVAASRGQVDRGFWQSFYKLNEESGGPRVTGWINVLFPYLNSKEMDEQPERGRQPTRNPLAGAREAAPWSGPAEELEDSVDDESDEWQEGPEPAEFPLGLSRAPFLWRFEDARYRMEFLGGFVGVSQDPETQAIRPAIGWAVREAPGDELGVAASTSSA